MASKILNMASNQPDVKARLDELEDAWEDYHQATLNPYSSMKRIIKKLNDVAILANNIIQELEVVNFNSDDAALFQNISTSVNNADLVWGLEVSVLDAARAYSAYAFREEVYTIWGLELSDDPEWATVGSEDDEDDLASEPSSDISFDDEE